MRRGHRRLPGDKREGAQLHSGQGDEEDQGQSRCVRGAPAGEGGGGEELSFCFSRAEEFVPSFFISRPSPA